MLAGDAVHTVNTAASRRPGATQGRDVIAADTVTVPDYLEVQWHNPSDILSILLILEPDIVQRAVVQLAGRIATPVAFSFGWVAQGNGSHHAIVILGKKGVGLDLEILAQGTRTERASWVARIATGVLALLWIILLLTVAGIKQNTWCTLLIHFALPL